MNDTQPHALVVADRSPAPPPVGGLSSNPRLTTGGTKSATSRRNWKHFQMLETIFKRPMGWFLHGDGEDNTMTECLTRVEDQLREAHARLGRIEELLRGLHPEDRGRPGAEQSRPQPTEG